MSEAMFFRADSSLSKFEIEKNIKEENVTLLAASSNGKFVAIWDKINLTIQLFFTQEEKSIKALQQNELDCLIFSQDSEYLLAASDKLIMIYSPKDLLSKVCFVNLKYKWKFIKSDFFQQLYVYYLFKYGYYSNRIEIFNLTNGQIVSTFKVKLLKQQYECLINLQPLTKNIFLVRTNHTSQHIIHNQVGKILQRKLYQIKLWLSELVIIKSFGYQLNSKELKVYWTPKLRLIKRITVFPEEKDCSVTSFITNDLIFLIKSLYTFKIYYEVHCFKSIIVKNEHLNGHSNYIFANHYTKIEEKWNEYHITSYKQHT